MLDIHLKNVLLKLPSTLDNLSIQQFYDQHGTPEIVLITQSNGDPLPPNFPPGAVEPLFLGKAIDNIELPDAQSLLSDFGEAFTPTSEVRLGRDSNIPLAYRAPEAEFEPDAPLSYPSDIWSLATAIWDIIGMKPIFSTDWVSEDEIAAQQIDVLGRESLPSEW